MRKNDVDYDDCTEGGKNWNEISCFPSTNSFSHSLFSKHSLCDDYVPLNLEKYSHSFSCSPKSRYIKNGSMSKSTEENKYGIEIFG